MASQHFTFADTSQPGVVPFNATFPFPSQVNKAVKIISQIPPKNGSTFAPGSTITVVIPAQGYVDPLKSTISFDLTMWPQVAGNGTGAIPGVTRMQNGANSVFKRIKWSYGSFVGEDVDDYDMIQRMLLEHTGTNQQNSLDNLSICAGVGGYTTDYDTAGYVGFSNVRQKYIQGLSTTDPTPGFFSGGAGFGLVPGGSDIPSGVNPPDQRQKANATTRRYQLNLGLGLFTQAKLIPVKWMGAALSIELTLAEPERCMYTPVLATDGAGATVTAITKPSYGIGNFYFRPEVLEFDSSYDEAFYEGLVENGCPIHYCTFNVTHFNNQSSQIMVPVPEKGRSVKAVFATQYRPIFNFLTDSGATFMDTAGDGKSTLQTLQFQIANRQHPGQPIYNSASGSPRCNGAAETYIEFQKAVNIMGDMRLSPNANAKNWGVQSANGALHEYDYSGSILSFTEDNVPTMTVVESAVNGFCGTMPSQAFVMAVNLETSNGVEISGLNSEEQSDIYIKATWAQPQTLGGASALNNDSLGFPGIRVAVYVDRVMILKQNNVGVIIQ